MPNKKCKWCKQENPNHWPYKCKQNPKTKKHIKRVGKHHAEWIEFRHEWIKHNASPSGTWECYLQISPQCPRTLTIQTLTLDHVTPRSGDPSKRLDPTNIKPACYWCNAMKGSKRLENL